MNSILWMHNCNVMHMWSEKMHAIKQSVVLSWFQKFMHTINGLWAHNLKVCVCTSECCDCDNVQKTNQTIK